MIAGFAYRLIFVLAALSVFVVPVARAQTTYSNTAGAPLDETVASCAVAPLIKTFVVPATTDTVGDVDLSVLITHTYRGDLELLLESPDGTRVQMTNRNGGAGGNNLNVDFDDEAATGYASASTSANHSATAPPYENTFSPESAFSAFDNEAIAGTWTLEMCDAFNADSGDYVRADLTLTAAVPNADLSLGVVASVMNPVTGSNTVLTYTLNNGGPDAVSGITVIAQLPAGLSYVSDTGAGAYDNATGVWTVPGSLASGGNAVLQITASANASGSGAVVTEVTAASLPDPDSTPDNRNIDPTEDDTGAVTLSINGPPPGTPPTLSCPVTKTIFDWDAEAWTTGAQSQSYASGVGLDFAFSGDTGFFVNNAAFGGQTPARNSVLSGGLSPVQEALVFVVNYTSRTQQVILTIDIGTAGEGVDNAQFSIFDVDLNPDTSSNVHFIDRLQIYGYLGGVATTPILTNGAANSVSGPTGTGIAGSASTSADGNLVVSFDTPVDQIVIYYDNDPAVAANPGQQGVSLHDITYCPRGRDYSDAPAVYGTPSHLITAGIRLGAVDPDRENASLPTVAADGDDTDATDDEEAASFPSLTQGQSTTLNVPVSGAGGYLRAWVDWDGDNVFEAGEIIADDLQTGTGSITVPITVPLSATTSQTYARLRWSTQSGLGADGDAASGEVEDYTLTIAPGVSVGCPSGFVLTTSSGNADAVIVTALNSANGLGVPETPGTTSNDSNSARLTNSQNSLVLDMTDTVAEGASLDLTIARNNGAANYDIDLSDDNVSYTNVATFNTGTLDSLAVTSVIVPAGGARYVRFQRNGGSLWVGGLAYSQICLAQASLTGAKTTVLYDPLSDGLFAIPGNDVIYTITVSNVGDTAADSATIELIDAMPSNIDFFNGTTPEFGSNVIGWTETGTTLTLDQALDVGYSNSGTAPTDFAACSYVPAAGYDPLVTYICFRPTGAMAAGDPDPEFSVSFRGRIK